MTDVHVDLQKSFQKLIEGNPPPTAGSPEWFTWLKDYYTNCLKNTDDYISTTTDKNDLTLLKKEKKFLKKALDNLKIKLKSITSKTQTDQE